MLACLRFDAATIFQPWNDGRSTFEEWADELGYDVDSRRAERTYNACVKVADDLCKFFGQHFDAFLMSDPEDPDSEAWRDITTTTTACVAFDPAKVEGFEA